MSLTQKYVLPYLLSSKFHCRSYGQNNCKLDRVVSSCKVHFLCGYHIRSIYVLTTVVMKKYCLYSPNSRNIILTVFLKLVFLF